MKEIWILTVQIRTVVAQPAALVTVTTSAAVATTVDSCKSNVNRCNYSDESIEIHEKYMYSSDR